jgi:hypothetical protein
MCYSCTQDEAQELYELRTYHFENPSQESRLDAYLSTALLPALHRQGIEKVGVFKFRGPEERPEAMILLIPYSSPVQYLELGSRLSADQDYLESGKDYVEASHDAPPYSRMESILMKAFDGSPRLETPELDGPREERVYELRSYQGATELLYERKVEMFDKGESELFRDLGFNPVFFGRVIASNQMPHLMYMTAFSDTLSQKEHWDAFRTDPRWEEMKGIERYKNTVSSIDKYMLYPTDYSDY